MEEVDGLLYYDEVKLQQCIEKEMREKGLAEGRAEKEQRKVLASAKKLVAMQVLTEEQIKEATGLSLEEIHALSNQ